MSKEIKDLLKKEIMGISSWKYVRTEVRDKLDWIINNIEDLGIIFRDAFDVLFKYEHLVRTLEGLTTQIDVLIPASLSKLNINEESFQCGRIPVKILLKLDDFFEPNDAEVQSVLFLCSKIEILKSSGIIQTSQQQIKTESELRIQQIIADAINASQKNPRKRSEKRELPGKTLTWEFTEPDSDQDIDELLK